MGLILYTSIILLILLSTIEAAGSKNNGYVRGCYFTNWSQYRPGQAKYLPENYVPGLCTHIYYAFAVMDDQFHLKSFEWDDEDTAGGPLGLYHRVANLRQQQPDLKVLLSFGGWTFTHDSQPALVSSMASTAANRAAFINSVVAFLRRIDYDGFDIDWEYPGRSDKANFTALISEMSAAFEAEARRSGRPRLLLTAAVAADPQKIEAGFDGKELSQRLDYFNVMTYDYHGSWDQKTGFNSPLFDNGDNFSISVSVEYWNKIGVPESKLIVGLASYGRGWILANASNAGIGAPTLGASPPQPFTREASVGSYYEICNLIEQNNFRENYDDLQQSAYAVGTQNGQPLWFGYDNVRSFNAKLDWIKQNGYGGAFVFSLDDDDFLGLCHSSNGQKYPLLNAINGKLGGGSTPQPPPSPPSTTPPPPPPPRPTPAPPPTSPPPPPPPPKPLKCTDGDILANPQSCESFFICDHSNPVTVACPAGLLFNASIKRCDWAYNVKCK